MIALNQFTRLEGEAISHVIGVVAGSLKTGRLGLLSSDYDEATGILDLSITTEVEELAIALCQSTYRELSDFYIAQSTDKHRNTYSNINIKVDSIEKILSASEYELAIVRDRGSSIVSNKNRIREKKIIRDIQLLSIMYGESLKNRETAKFLLDNSTPFFYIIDDVRTPLPQNMKSKVIQSILYAVVGGVLIALVLVARKIYEDATKKSLLKAD